MQYDENQLKMLFVYSDYIQASDFDNAIKISKKENKDIDEVLIDKGYIHDEQFGQVVAQSFGFLFVNLRNENIDREILEKIPEIFATSNGIIAFDKIDDTKIKLGMLDPSNFELIKIVEKKIGKKVVPYFITKNDFKYGLLKYKVDVKNRFLEVSEELKKATKENRDELIINFIDALLEYGFYNKASDIHIEPYADSVIIRLRIDGIMHEVVEMPKKFMDPILIRIKILSKIKMDEHQSALDGKMKIKIGLIDLDVRVSVVPVTGGENVVMRLLHDEFKKLSLSELGFVDNDFRKVKEALGMPYGMVLVTGPTGSGKTTTIYEMIKLLNNDEVHIATIEDPVEYNIEGISQIQVNNKTNLTFANGLRAIVRQDPDIIMVGEVRDPETASIAINSAMTGHLVLSTIHANDASTTLPRLADMGIEDYLLTSTIQIIISQRLTRKICEKCRESYNITDEEINIIKNSKNITDYFKKKKKDINSLILYKAQGCDNCSGTGYKGRIGVFEVLLMSEEIKKLILKQASSSEILEQALKENFTTMLEDGLGKVLNGITTLQEVLRVVRF